MKLKKTCCEKYRTKGKACDRCPVVAVLSKRERRELLGTVCRKLTQRKKREKKKRKKRKRAEWRAA